VATTRGFTLRFTRATGPNFVPSDGYFGKLSECVFLAWCGLGAPAGFAPREVNAKIMRVLRYRRGIFVVVKGAGVVVVVVNMIKTSYIELAGVGG